jgi:hypothetical protein
LTIVSLTYHISKGGGIMPVRKATLHWQFSRLAQVRSSHSHDSKVDKAEEHLSCDGIDRSKPDNTNAISWEYK